MRQQPATALTHAVAKQSSVRNNRTWNTSAMAWWHQEPGTPQGVNGDWCHQHQHQRQHQHKHQHQH